VAEVFLVVDQHRKSLIGLVARELSQDWALINDGRLWRKRGQGGGNFVEDDLPLSLCAGTAQRAAEAGRGLVDLIDGEVKAQLRCQCHRGAREHQQAQTNSLHLEHQRRSLPKSGRWTSAEGGGQ